jgi:hypothetical protein
MEIPHPKAEGLFDRSELSYLTDFSTVAERPDYLLDSVIGLISWEVPIMR